MNVLWNSFIPLLHDQTGYNMLTWCYEVKMTWIQKQVCLMYVFILSFGRLATKIDLHPYSIHPGNCAHWSMQSPKQHVIVMSIKSVNCQITCAQVNDMIGMEHVYQSNVNRTCLHDSPSNMFRSRYMNHLNSFERRTNIYIGILNHICLYPWDKWTGRSRMERYIYKKCGTKKEAEIHGSQASIQCL